MAGGIRTKEKCPKCEGKFRGEPLLCPNCLTTPRRYFVHFSWRSQPIKLYSGKDGHPLDSWERAYRLLTAMRNEMDLGKFDPRDYAPHEIRNLRFANYYTAWIDRRTLEKERRHISKSYLKTLREYGRNYFTPFFGITSMRDIRSGDIEDFRNQLPAHLGAKTVYNLLGVLHKLFKDAYRRDDILVIPQFPKIEVGEPVIRWIEPHEQERLLSRAKEPYRSFFLFLMRQGCRPAEGRALKWEDVKLQEGIVIIRAAMDLNEYRPFTKEREVRYLPLHPEVREALAKLPRPLHGGYVFVNRAGRPLGASQVIIMWSKAAQAAGVKISCYQGTKHSLGSQAINRGVSERLLAEFFGHKDLRSTRRYSKVVTETLKGVWNLSPEFVPNLSPEKKGGNKNE